MVDQTQIEIETVPRETPAADCDTDRGLRRGVTDLIGDAITLIELQYRLFMNDSRSAASGSIFSALLILAGAIGFVCAIPVALIGISHLLTMTGLKLAWALVIVSAVAGLIGLVVAVVGSRRLRRSVQVFERSRMELENNIQWLKQALRGSHNRHAFDNKRK